MPTTIAAAGALTPLLLLACPVGMGLMMWIMSKGSRQRDQPPSPRSDRPKDEPPLSVDELRAEHSRLTAQIDQLEAAERERARPAADHDPS